jgi:hypothetical protein
MLKIRKPKFRKPKQKSDGYGKITSLGRVMKKMSQISLSQNFKRKKIHAISQRK